MLHDTELLQYVYKTGDMGCKGIESVLGYTQSTDLREKLTAQEKEYQKIRGQARLLLEKRNEQPAGAGPMAKASADLMTTGEMIINHTDSKIAEMTIQGNQTGVSKTIKHLHSYSGQDGAVRSLAEKLLATEESNAEQLKGFL